jgi:predicted membrane-bound dolichyl-phosphate-mannose-protein mannosyltransferase
MRRRLMRAVRARRAPLVVLALVCAGSLAARAAWLSDPCSNPCRGPSAHAMIFDEVYYVNAARRIDGIAVPAGQHYAGTPAGEDPNSEHPQLAKLIIAGAIDLFGDGPFAWRIGSLIFGTLAIIGMFALAAAAGARPWCAVLAATLMAADTLMLVHGRIGTLDIYVLAFMDWAGALYLRDQPLLAGIALGIGATAKLVAPYLVLVLVLVELFRHRRAFMREAGAALVGATAMATGTYLALLALFDRIAPPYVPQTGSTIRSGPLAHTAHMMSYAAAQTSPHGPTGIQSYPWGWLVDIKPILYLNVTVRSPTGTTSTVHFLGLINPPILLFAIPALALAAWAIWQRRAPVAGVALAWFLGTWLPFVALSLFWQRTSYLYYMVIVMPGIYLAVARLFSLPRMPAWARVAFLCLVVAATVLTYPFLALPASL